MKRGQGGRSPAPPNLAAPRAEATRKRAALRMARGGVPRSVARVVVWRGPDLSNDDYACLGLRKSSQAKAVNVPLCHFAHARAKASSTSRNTGMRPKYDDP